MINKKNGGILFYLRVKYKKNQTLFKTNQNKNLK